MPSTAAVRTGRRWNGLDGLRKGGLHSRSRLRAGWAVRSGLPTHFRGRCIWHSLAGARIRRSLALAVAWRRRRCRRRSISAVKRPREQAVDSELFALVTESGSEYVRRLAAGTKVGPAVAEPHAGEGDWGILDSMTTLPRTSRRANKGFLAGRDASPPGSWRRLFRVGGSMAGRDMGKGPATVACGPCPAPGPGHVPGPPLALRPDPPAGTRSRGFRPASHGPVFHQRPWAGARKRTVRTVGR